MNILKKIFGNQDDAPESSKKEVESPYNTDATLPVDEQFTLNFKTNGGKFLYCENKDELNDNFELILEENDWFEKDVQCIDSRLCHILEDNKLNYINPKNPSFFFTTCEGLIADEGSILFSSKQLSQHKIDELPENVVVFAGTSMLKATKSDGMRALKTKYGREIPSNITAIKYFKETKDDNFLNYGSCHKNLYLLLLEDS
jgi:hypothetical protein